MDWKAAPTDTAKLWLNKSLEIQIMLACNWTCHACDQLSQFSRIAWIKKGTMSIEQIEHFVGEMHAHNAYIGRIRLVGGEPSLHPKLSKIIGILNTLILDGHLGQLEIVTNGSHPEKIKAARAENGDSPLKVRVSDEGDKQKHHTANLLYTPHSLGYEGKMCNAPWHCGMSLNYYGYFPCSSGAGLARLFDDMPRWQRLTLPLSTSKPCNAVRDTWPELQQLCNLCYHGLKPEHKQKCGTGQLPGQAELNQPGPAIQPHLQAWLDGKQPDWKVYGAQAV